MNDEILTIEEAAALLKVKSETITDLLVSNELAGRKIGGEWRTTKRALVSFVDGVPLQMMCCTTEMCCVPSSQADAGEVRASTGRCCR